MPERVTQLYSKCTLCDHAAGYGFPEGECPGCDGSGYVPAAQASACIDHDFLDLIPIALEHHGDDVERLSECVEFTDPRDGKRYEIVVREVDQADDDEEEEEDDEGGEG